MRIKYGRLYSDPCGNRNSADTILLYLVCVLSGFFQLAASTIAPSVHRQLGDPWGQLWAGGLLVFGVIGLVSAYWKDKITGLLIERGARIAIGSSSLVYAFALIYSSRSNAIVSSLFGACYGVACLIRAAHITLWLRQIKVIHGYDR